MLAFAPSGALTFACLALLLPPSLAATSEEWRGRSIYQVMTDRFALPEQTLWMPCHTDIGPYCGGTWRGIMENLDYIQGMNFDAIWISPVTAQLPQYTEDGRSYAGYWQQDLYSLNPEFGTLDDFHNLIKAVHGRGMLFMLDIVTNHMAYNSMQGDGAPAINYTIMNPFNDQKYYHQECSIDYSGNNLTSLEECWLGSRFVPLPDLRTEDDDVRNMFGDWIEQMVANYSIDGLRIDAGINVEPEFFTGFVKRAGVFATTEVYHSNDSIACQWQETAGSILNYPQYWPITSAFQSNGDFGDLTTVIESERQNCQDTTVLGTFSENQDVPRFANHTSDLALAKNVATYVLMADGIPIIYQGQEQHFSGGTNPFTNREPLWETGFNVFAPLYQHISSLNTLRQHTMTLDSNYTTAQSSVLHQDKSTLIMAKGGGGKQIIAVFTNAGEGATSGTWDLDVSSLNYPASTSQLTEVLTCTNYTISPSHTVSFPMTGGEPRILYPASLLAGSSLCGEGGRMFNDKVTNQTVTATTFTTTVGSAPTVMVASVTVPIGEAEQTGGAASATGSSSAVRRVALGSSSSSWTGPAGTFAVLVMCGMGMSLLVR
ncbi:hypothetical protein LTR91_011542 [Friedmanniomyces endolithicus]|uniref:alpha-amylase n=1 Tax=Friedmanniomyces endolithicus TaxID=329885 RepID=A0AAN6KHI4_9PEZI|nr:hypothetical protein LTR57_006159 [Friedmanniomyces endolithicus]KAK0982516.1 hypothetical protein LTR91_011542 [Friedmanniomyces endolithicus]KAK0998767.1 hypothetical protein LTS01_005594 [Friedmanniomyces endolithicus]KAK1040875.1 hypothetical protein LTS16_009990 [Friedmanniomyces endolithicus]